MSRRDRDADCTFNASAGEAVCTSHGKPLVPRGTPRDVPRRRHRSKVVRLCHSPDPGGRCATRVPDPPACFTWNTGPGSPQSIRVAENDRPGMFHVKHQQPRSARLARAAARRADPLGPFSATHRVRAVVAERSARRREPRSQPAPAAATASSTARRSSAAISSSCPSVTTYGGARRTWSPCTPSIVPPIG